jgi:hypothetical protein
MQVRASGYAGSHPGRALDGVDAGGDVGIGAGGGAIGRGVLVGETTISCEVGVGVIVTSEVDA